MSSTRHSKSESETSNGWGIAAGVATGAVLLFGAAMIAEAMERKATEEQQAKEKRQKEQTRFW
jgi:hypothetical protein